MKNNLYLLIAAVLVSFSGFSQVEFKPGIRAGLNFSHFSKGDNEYSNDTTNDRNFKSKTAFYFGFYGAIKLTEFYTLQPEIDYSKQGSIYKFENGESALREEKLQIDYLSIAVANKFTFNKLNVHVGPTIDFVVDKNFDADAEVDLAFFLGAGYNFTDNLGIEARVKKGIVPVLDFSDGNHTNVVFSLGATYTFDVK